jgi:hypothetical protein
MLTLRGRIEGRRLYVDDLIDLPDGTEVEVALVDNGYDMDDAERAQLHQDLLEGLAQVERGECVPMEEVLSELDADLP